MANKIYYQRIDINGDESKLPKEKGTYMICNRQSFYMQTRFNPKLNESKRVWLKEVIWWEKPIEIPCTDKRDELIASELQESGERNEVTMHDLRNDDNARDERKEYDCICKICKSEFKSNIADFDICPSCYV
jgi:hypothetical protein